MRNISQIINKSSKTTNVTSVKLNDDIVTDSGGMAEIFNNCFTGVGIYLSKQVPEGPGRFEDYIKPVNSIFQFKIISVREVEVVLSELQTSKSCGPDKISATLLKNFCEISAHYLTLIYNCSLVTGIFPDDWKLARVSPIYKSGDKQQCGNYRPISVLSVAAKVFEKLVSDQLNDYLRRKSILTESQSGFTKGYSTASSLLTTTNSWLIYMDSGLIDGVLFLDLKAFDTVRTGDNYNI